VAAASPLPRRAALQYGVAYLGAHLAFMPLLVLLLPRRVESIAQQSAGELLSWLLLSGAVMAALAHILAGHSSDRWLERHGNRRGLIAIGAAALAGSYLLLAQAYSFALVMAAILLFQLAVNIAFAPLGALIADHFANEHKGRMGALMNAALPASSLSVVLVGWLFPEDGATAFVFTGVLALAFFLPLLVNWNLGPVQEAQPSPADGPAPDMRRSRLDFSLAWGARLCVQLGSAFVHGYIYLYLATLVASGSGLQSATDMLATLSGPAAVLAIVVTLAIGSLSDRAGQRRRPLMLASVAVALGLVLLAQSQGMAMLLAGYAIFQVGLSTFLSIDTAMVAQLVSGNRNRGTLLGVMNLTNTLPSIIAPGLALLAFHERALQQQLSVLFIACAVLALLGGIGIQFIRTVP